MPHLVRAAFFDGINGLKVSDLQLADPGPEEVLVQVHACGICGSDLHQLQGRWEQPAYVPGHEVAGVVCATGAGVTHVTVGDRVCVEPFVYCGTCRYCRAGRYFLCPAMGFLSLTAHGGLAQKLLTPAYALHRLPEEVSCELGALTEPLAVAVHAVRLAAVSGADGVLVLGAGTIGLMSVAAARHLGSHTICITARYPHQAEAALALGATAVLSTDTPTLKQQLTDYFLEGPAVVLESVGSAAHTFQQALEVAGKLGRIALMGGNTGAMDGVHLGPVITKELTVLGSACYAQLGIRRDFEIALDILAAQPEVFARLITHRYPLEDVRNAFTAALSKQETRALKVLVMP